MNTRTNLNRSKKVYALICGLMAAAMILGACTGQNAQAQGSIALYLPLAAKDSGVMNTPTPTVTATVTPTAVPTATRTPVPTEPPSEVSMAGFSFVPATLTVPDGTTVTWSNDSSFNHTVTADNGMFDSGVVAPGDTFSFTFDTPGNYLYYCVLHGGPGGIGMSGMVIVTP
jgi:plastocyanin